MGRRRFDPREMPQRAHRVNRDIRISSIRVIGAEGEQLGIMSPHQAREIATEAGLDLVEVAPTAQPPVCKIMDYGKFRYDLSKKAQASRTATPQLKTVQLRPKTDDHDLKVKLNHARSFLERGDKVRLVMRLRGREQAFIDRWINKLREHVDTMSDVCRIASAPSRQGRQILMLLEPTGGGGGGSQRSDDSGSDESDG